MTSIEGKGSRFWFTIEANICSEEYMKKDQISKKLINNGVTQQKILLVEDNLINQKVAITMLSKFNCEIQTACNGQVAIDMAQKTEFDLIFMDMQMPIMGGIEATENIRLLDNSNSKIPILAMTANARKEDQELCIKAGMNGFISKPIDPSNLRLKYETWVEPKI